MFQSEKEVVVVVVVAVAVVVAHVVTLSQTVLCTADFNTFSEAVARLEPVSSWPWS